MKRGDVGRDIGHAKIKLMRLILLYSVEQKLKLGPIGGLTRQVNLYKLGPSWAREMAFGGASSLSDPTGAHFILFKLYPGPSNRDSGLGTDFSRFVNQFDWATNHIGRVGPCSAPY